MPREVTEEEAAAVEITLVAAPPVAANNAAIIPAGGARPPPMAPHAAAPPPAAELNLLNLWLSPPTPPAPRADAPRAPPVVPKQLSLLFTRAEQEILVSAFMAADDDGSGKLELAELAEALRRMNGWQTIDEAAVAAFMSECRAPPGPAGRRAALGRRPDRTGPATTNV